MNLRGRLFVAFIALTLLVLAAVGSLSFSLLQRHALAQARSQLTVQADRVGRLLSQGPQSVHFFEPHNPAIKRLLGLAGGLSRAEFSVVDASGQLLHRSRRLGDLSDPAARAVIRHVLANGASQHATVSGAGGIPTIIAAAPIRTSGGQLLGAVILGRSLRSIGRTAALALTPVWSALLVGLVLSVAAAYWLARSIAGPLAGMAAAAEQVSRGDFSLHLPSARSDEIGRLAASFNHMAARLDDVLRSRREFVAAISHELRTPVASIQGLVQALQDGIVPRQEQQPTLTVVAQEVARVVRLVEDLFDLAKLQTGQFRFSPQPVDPKDLCDQVMARARVLAGEAGPRVTAAAACDPGLIVEVDPDRMVQALSNLMGNAIRLVPAGGTVRLNVGASPLPGKLRFAVTDSGPGIGPEALPHVFDRFYTDDPSRSGRGGGAGLGLAITREIVQQHGGAVGVDSAPGRGTTFWIDLPATRSA